MKRFFKEVSLAAIFLISPLQLQSKQTGNIEDTIQTIAIHENVSSLLEYLESRGFQINGLLQDQRFEIYHKIRGEFRNSAERKSKNLDEYKKKIEYESKKDNIHNFVNENINQLRRAEETFDIPIGIISAVLGVESDFGKNAGKKYNPFNVYVSMYVDNYRTDFAKEQLEELLVFCEKNEIDVFSLKSSYAGAISYAQFIHSSLNRWFIGKDLYNMDNNILSVANYLSHFRKRTGTLEEAVYKYNPSNFYVEVVMDLAKEAEEILSRTK